MNFTRSGARFRRLSSTLLGTKCRRFFFPRPSPDTQSSCRKEVGLFCKDKALVEACRQRSAGGNLCRDFSWVPPAAPCLPAPRSLLQRELGYKMATTSFNLLYESASGYALFSVLEGEEIGALLTEVQSGTSDFARFQRVVKMTGFSPFDTAELALENINAITEHEVTDDLKVRPPAACPTHNALLLLHHAAKDPSSPKALDSPYSPPPPSLPPPHTLPAPGLPREQPVQGQEGLQEPPRGHRAPARHGHPGEPFHSLQVRCVALVLQLCPLFFLACSLPFFFLVPFCSPPSPSFSHSLPPPPSLSPSPADETIRELGRGLRAHFTKFVKALDKGCVRVDVCLFISFVFRSALAPLVSLPAPTACIPLFRLCICIHYTHIYTSPPSPPGCWSKRSWGWDMHTRGAR